MGEGTKQFATSVLRLAVVWLGMFAYRLVQGAEIAMPPQLAVQSGGSEQNFAGPVLLSQAQPISSSIPPVEDAASTANSSTEPQSSTSEAVSVARLPVSGQTRRRPKMAGIPEGSKTAEQPPENPPETQQAATAEKQTAGTEAPPVPAVNTGIETQPGTAEAGAEALNAEEDNTPGAIARRKAEEAQGENRKYALAPIHWRGIVFDTLAWTRNRYWGASQYLSSPNGQPVLLTPIPDSFMNFKGAVLQGRTFILHPWIATVYGGLGVVNQTINYKGVDNNHNNQLLSMAGLDVFSASRFPFSMLWDVKDSRTNDQQADSKSYNDTVNKSLNITQIYKPLYSPATYNFGYDYNKTSFQNYSLSLADLFSQLSGSEYVYTNLHGNYQSRLGSHFDQPFNLYGSHETTSVTSSPEELRDNVFASHIYMPEDSLLTLSSYGSFFQSRIPGYISRNFQLGSNANWQPEDLDNPLVVYGGASYFGSQNEIPGSSLTSQVLSANVQATYNKWAHLALSGGGTVTETTVNGASNLATTQFGHALYDPGWMSLSNGLRYRKLAEAGFNNLTSSLAGSDLTTYTGVSHSLASQATKTQKGFGQKYRVSVQATQSFYVRTDTLHGSSETLTNSANVTWLPWGLRKTLPSTRSSTKDYTERSTGAANLLTSVGLYVNDSKRWGYLPSHTQSFRISVGAGAGGGYLANASGYGAKADLSIEYARSTVGPATGGLIGNAAWGHKFIYDYHYAKHKVFNIKALNYGLRFQINIDPELQAYRMVSFQTSQQYAQNYTVVGYGVSLDQALQYRIGKNEVTLTASIADNYGVATASLFLRFRAWRFFGN